MSGPSAYAAFSAGVAAAAESLSISIQALRPEDEIPAQAGTHVASVVGLLNLKGNAAESRSVLSRIQDEVEKMEVGDALVVLAPISPFEADSAAVNLFGSMPELVSIDGAPSLDEFTRLVEQYTIDVVTRVAPELEDMELAQEGLLGRQLEKAVVTRRGSGVAFPRRRS